MKMKKRAALAISLAMFAGCATQQHSTQTAAAKESKPERRPNVVVLLADDLGYADVGVQGQMSDVKTPNIDSIAHNGVRFTNGYVSCPVCSPTRAGFLTGRYQQRFGHEFNPGGNDPAIFGLPKDQVTIADVMKRAGYVTGMCGKWHEGQNQGYWPNDRGFDEFYGFLGGSHSYINNEEPRGINSIRRNREPIGEKEYLTDAIGREAVSFIDRHKDEKFFLYVPFNAVHTPMQAPEKYLNRFPEVKDKVRRTMLAKLSACDDAVGRIMGSLRKNNLENDTLVFFFSDNGGPSDTNGSYNKPYSGYKGQVWEGGIHEPFMAQWPGHVAKGKVLDQPVIALDILPTAAALGGAEVPKDRVMDGVDLMPLMTGKTEKGPHQTLFWRMGAQHAVRDGNYKLVRFDGFGEKLFDLSKDAGEANDLLATKPQVASKLRSELAEWESQMAKPRWGSKPKFKGDDNIEKISKKQFMKETRKAATSPADEE